MGNAAQDAFICNLPNSDVAAIIDTRVEGSPAIDIDVGSHRFLFIVQHPMSLDDSTTAELDGHIFLHQAILCFNYITQMMATVVRIVLSHY